MLCLEIKEECRAFNLNGASLPISADNRACPDHTEISVHSCLHQITLQKIEPCHVGDKHGQKYPEVFLAVIEAHCPVPSRMKLSLVLLFFGSLRLICKK